MALLTCNFYSHALEIQTAAHVILPQQGVWHDVTPRRSFPVLWLLHGLSDDHTIWLRRTSIERYVEGLPLAVVMPAVNRSFYADMRSGARYWTFVSEELPALMRGWFPISSAREDNFVAGLSMGGFGAFKLALNHPDRFAAAASLSGALDIARHAAADPALRRELKLIYGGAAHIAGGDSDLWRLARALVDSQAERPMFYAACGTEDFLYEENLDFREYAAQIGMELTYEEGPGDHTWELWDMYIQRVLRWLPLQDAG